MMRQDDLAPSPVPLARWLAEECDERRGVTARQLSCMPIGVLLGRDLLGWMPERRRCHQGDACCEALLERPKNSVSQLTYVLNADPNGLFRSVT